MRAIHGTLRRMSPEYGIGTPQFDKVEYAAAPGTNTCVLCGQPISGTYYRINGEQACSGCVEREQAAQRDSAANYSRALMFGIGAAIIGLIAYATFEIVTGWIIGYLSLGVGWFIAKAMLIGSKGMGGRKYQFTAVLLTYAAVSMAAIPLWIWTLSKERKEQQHAQVQVQPPTSNSTAVPESPATTSTTPSDSVPETSANTSTTVIPQGESEKNEPKMSLGKALGMLVVIGLASPFLELADPIHGLIGLFILFIGLQIAWKMTGRPKLLIDGPF